LAAALFAPLEPAFAIQTEIRVRLERQLTEAVVSGYGLQITRPSNFIAVAIPPQGLRRAKIKIRKDGSWSVKWDSDAKAQVIPADRLSVRGQMVRVGPKPVPYGFEIHRAAKDRKMDLIARLDLETYLAGVLPAEMPISWPLEALKAQVVAARSYALRMAFDRRGKPFDVDSTIDDQVYKFFTESEKHPEWRDKLNRAVGETEGEVLVDGKRRLLKAFYSADCGCQSEDPKYVWGHIESFQSVKDPACAGRRPTLWNLSLQRSEVRGKLISALGLPDNAGLRTVLVGGRTPSGRVFEVIAAVDIDGRTKNYPLRAQEFRRIFGFQNVRSAAFSLKWLADKLEISGQGAGHGVGLCQRGARSLAEQGMDYRGILKIFYPKAIMHTRKQT
jgi:stage II sporulation protein D